MSSKGAETASLSVEGLASQQQNSPSITSHTDSRGEMFLRDIESEYNLYHLQSSICAEVKQSPLLRLPYELRRKIFRSSTCYVRSPSKEGSSVQAYAQDLVAFLEDGPSPLLGVNRQIRAEVIDVLKSRKDFGVRVTSYGITFITNSLTTMIAQNRPKSFNGLPRLHIAIWPPHPDRPVDMIHLDENVHKLRKTLYALPQIPKLFIWFENHRLVKWCQYEEQQMNLKYHHKYLHNDMEMVLDHFARITKAEGIKIRLSRNTAHNINTRLYAAGEMKETEYGCLEFELKKWDKSDGPYAYDPFLSISLEDWLCSILPSVPSIY